jgi:8-oxo-dGTP diphosphatase
MNPALPYCYEYPRPAVSADCAVFGIASGILNILLIQRGNDPFKGKWSLPGGFMNMDENAEECAKRELFEETGLKITDVEQLHTATDVDRDPRGRVVTVVYMAFVKPELHTVKAGDDASNAKWFPVSEIPLLAFDHGMIIDLAVKRMEERRA